MKIAAVRTVLVAATALLGACGALPVAYADDSGPLHRLVDTAAQRLLTADPVAEFKWVKGGSIEDGARANQVLDAVGADGNKRGLDERYVRRAFENQIHATEGVEYTRFGQWKFDPGHAPTSARDLSQTRTEIDDFNRVMVAEMTAQRGVLFSQGCAAALDDARSSVSSARALDPLYRRALEVATSSYCAG
ncbi:chorismate mutase [Mycobacterium sp. NPDC003449]